MSDRYAWLVKCIEARTTHHIDISWGQSFLPSRADYSVVTWCTMYRILRVAHRLKRGGEGALTLYYVILLMHSNEAVCGHNAKCLQPRKDIISLGQKNAYEIFYTILQCPLFLLLAFFCAPFFHSSLFILFTRVILWKRAKKQAYSARYFLILCDNVVVLKQLEKS